MPVALITNYLAPYRVPLYELLAERYGVEVLCFGGGKRYVPAWFADLDGQLSAARFPARRLDGPGEALGLGRSYDAVIAPFAGGSILPAAYAGARRGDRPFILWASVWAEPRSAVHTAGRMVSHHIYKRADALLAYGEHVRRFAGRIRGHDDDIFVAPQSVEAQLFGRSVTQIEVVRFRRHHDLPDGPIVLYVGRLVPEKGVDVLLRAWREIDATLVVIGDGPLAGMVERTPRTRLLGPRPRSELPVAYAATEFALLPSVPTPRFREPWGLVCNEAMHQGRPMVASDSVGAVAGGLVRHGENGLVVPAGDVVALRRAIRRLLGDELMRQTLGTAARAAVVPYTYDAMAGAFGRALAVRSRK